MCIVATTSVGVQQATGFATLYWGAEVVWNIRLRGGIFFLLASVWIFSRYINAIARQGWVEQSPPAVIDLVHCLRDGMHGGGKQRQLLISRWHKVIDTDGQVSDLPLIAGHVEEAQRL